MMTSTKGSLDMKKRDFFVIGIVLVLALVIGAVALLDGRTAQSLCIYVEGDLYGEYSLLENQEIKVGTTNVCEIIDGKVRMTQANCPDQICVHTAEISRDGMTIVCLPNRVVLEIKSEAQSQAPIVDGVA